MTRLRNWLSWLFIAMVQTYQLCISPILGPKCRFQPSCSQYVIDAIRKYGPARGLWRGTKRICRCHPWNEGGYDPA